MEITINNDCFNKAISEVSKAVSLKTPLPILTGVKIIANHESLTLIGSNSDIVIEKNIPNKINGRKVLDVYKTGSVVISAKYLSEIVKKLPNDIHLNVSDSNIVTIQSDEIKTDLNGFNPVEYPNLPTIDNSNNIRIASNELIEIIKQTVFAVSKSETRPVLTGVHISFQDDLLTSVATNSHRLALRKHKISSLINSSCIVPSVALNEFTKLFDSDSATIDVSIADNYIVFKSNSTALYSRLIEGNYPNISDLIPKESKTTITLDTKQLLRGIDRACLFVNEWRNNNVYVEINGDNKLKISSNSTEVGKIEESQNINTIQGEKELSISLDGKFVMDALKAIQEDEVSISFSGSRRPILIHPIGNTTHLQLISPVRSY